MSESFSLEMPRSSPKMERIFMGLEQGFPNARVNQSVATKKILWGLIGNNARWITAEIPYIFTDMPYHGRMDSLLENQFTDEDWLNTNWRFCVQGLHDNRKLDVPSDRFESWNLDIKPYREEGEFILICPSSNPMTRLMHGVDANTWAHTVAEEVQKHTNKMIKIRYKPRSKKTSGPTVADVSIDSELNGCHAVVTSASLTAIDALKQGVPVFGTHHLCPAAWCANRDLSYIDKPSLLDREELFNNLAYKQYSIREMRDGICYENYVKYLR